MYNGLLISMTLKIFFQISLKLLIRIYINFVNLLKYSATKLFYVFLDNVDWP